MCEQTIPHYLVLLFRGENYARLDSFADDHISFIKGLIRDNAVFIGGDLSPFEPHAGNVLDGIVGAYLLKTRGREDAVKIANNDPMIRNNIWMPVFLQWDLVGMEEGGAG